MMGANKGNERGLVTRAQALEEPCVIVH